MARRSVVPLIALAPAVVLAASALAAPLPVGDEIAVDQTVARADYEPAVAVAPDGSFLVLWLGPIAGDAYGMKARRFASNGAALSDEIAVRGPAGGFLGQADLSAFPDGEYLATWSEDDRDGDWWGIFATVLDAQGLPVGGDFQVNTATAGSQYKSSSAVAEDGSFAIVWQSLDDEAALPNRVMARAFGPDRQPLGPELPVDESLGEHVAPDVAAGAAGYRVAWQDGYGFDDSVRVLARSLDAGGAPVDDEYRIGLTAPLRSGFPSLAVGANDETIVAWHDGNRLRNQRFDESGRAVSFRGVVSNFLGRPLADRYGNHAIAASPDGEAVVVWLERSGFSLDGIPVHVIARTVRAFGFPSGPEVRVSQNATIFPAGCPPQPNVCVVPISPLDIDGRGRDFVAVWQRTFAADGGDPDIVARRLRLP